MVGRAVATVRFKAKSEDVKVRFSTAQGGNWNLLTSTPSSSATATLTTEVTHDGYPVVRIDLPDACTQCYIGVTTGKTFTIPKDWNGEFGVAYNVASKYDSLTSATLYLTDTGFTNHWSKQFLYSLNSTVWKYNGWRVHRWRTVGVTDTCTATGTPTIAGANSCRLRFNKTAGAGTACSIYVAWMGIPAKQRPQVMFTFDGGTVGQYANLFPLVVAKNAPIAIGVQSDPISQAAVTHISGANIQEMYATGLVEFYSYSRKLVNCAVSDPSMGVATFLADHDTSTAYLRSLGVKKPALFIPYPLGDYTDALMDGLMDRGVRIGRRADGAGCRFNDTANCFTGKQMMSMDITLSMSTAVTLAQAKAAFDESLSANEHVITLCHQVNAAGDTTSPGWPVDYWSAFIDHVKMREKQGLCDLSSVETFHGRLTNPRFSKGG